MKKIIILLCFIILIGCQKTKEQTINIIQIDTNIYIIDPNVVVEEIITCLRFNGYDGKSASINFDPNGIYYTGDLPIKKSARIFFREVYKLLCECYCNEGWVDKMF